MVKINGKEVVQYDHRGVVFHLAGFPIVMPLDVEMICPGEWEVIAAKRLLERVIRRYGRFFDFVLTDALYFEAPFFNLCLKHHKHIITVLKGEQRALFQDAQGVFSLMKPMVWIEGRCRIRAWDAEDFTTAEGIEVPLRVPHTEARVTKRHCQNHQWIQKIKIHHWWWVTTLPMSRLSTRLLCYLAHRRREIENDLFHTLLTYWSLNHCFKHEPTAILNFILTLFIAFMLLQSFYYGNLQSQRRIHLTLIGLATELHLGVVIMNIPAPWVCSRGG